MKDPEAGVSDQPTNCPENARGPAVHDFVDTPLKAAIRHAFDYPSLSNIEAVAAAQLAATHAAIRALRDEWQADLDTCLVCRDGADEPCEQCLMTARHIGALDGTLARLLGDPAQEQPK